MHHKMEKAMLLNGTFISGYVLLQFVIYSTAALYLRLNMFRLVSISLAVRKNMNILVMMSMDNVCNMSLFLV